MRYILKVCMCLNFRIEGKSPLKKLLQPHCGGGFGAKKLLVLFLITER